MQGCGEKPISEYRAIFDYAESIRLPVDFLQLAWAEVFPAPPPGRVDCRKKKSDWRAYFRKRVEGNWYHPLVPRRFDPTSSPDLERALRGKGDRMNAPKCCACPQFGRGL